MKHLIFCLLLFLFLTPTALAQEELEINTVTPSPAPTVEYTLPYPGILPDNPLYPVKAARDRIVSFFISDPQRKAEFDLLQSDKRVQAGLFLLHEEKPNVPLALSTISKGQNYYEEALVAAGKARKEKDPGLLGDLTSRLVRSARKQQELLATELKQVDSASQDDLKQLVKRSQGLVTAAKQLEAQRDDAGGM